RALSRARNPRLAVQPRRQVWRRRGPDRAGLGRRRPRSDARAPARIHPPNRAKYRALTTIKGFRSHSSERSNPPAMSRVGRLLIEPTPHADPAIRARPIRELTAHASLAEKLEACDELEQFRRTCQNLYERVRASLFLHALHRYEIQDDPAVRGTGLLPYAGF